MDNDSPSNSPKLAGPLRILASNRLALAEGVLLGLLAGFYGGKVDMLLMRLTEINMTIPSVLLGP